MNSMIYEKNGISNLTSTNGSLNLSLSVAGNSNSKESQEEPPVDPSELDNIKEDKYIVNNKMTKKTTKTRTRTTKMRTAKTTTKKRWREGNNPRHICFEC